MRLRCLAAAAGLLFALVTGAGAAEPAACKVVRMADIGWADVTATTALTGVLLKDLGYQPKLTVLSIAGTYQALHNKEIDAFLGNWMPAMEADRKPFIDDKSVEVLNANLEGAKYTLAVPQYLYDKGLHDFSDIQKFAKDLNFKIYGIEPGNDGNRHILDMIRANTFGLGKFQLVESGEKGMLAQVEKDYRAGRPIVFLGWQPHPMNKLFKMAYLTGGDDMFGPNYGAAAVYTNIRAGYADDCPNVVRLLNNESFSLSGEDEMMDLILNKKMDPTRAATVWLKAHKDVLTPWLAGVTTLDGKPALPAVQSRL